MTRLIRNLILIGIPIATMVSVVLPGGAVAQQRPQALGTFADWTAAAMGQGSQKICYAFTRASKTDGAGNRQNVILTVTHRPQGRDQVALQSGYTYVRNAEVEIGVGGTDLEFYPAQDNAYAREGTRAVAAFKSGANAVARGTGPQGRGTATDTFSLSGFTAAYEAISKECPAARR
ncbi:invasion associated locus B family protein [Teichococcus vastitatis]|uniref:Invasion associated locus B family protein n=1 Tax=Teichococcus vastitatis TaxID=2307076 RepID=A0ABS9VZZ5_9PROT|nr:invasion associated locus B family protein [Pseudoroseomonas vastitatis]MCI0752507.1 invasion associated locus B family protein [Pseudoroseomonas vastitatis]